MVQPDELPTDEPIVAQNDIQKADKVLDKDKTEEISPTEENPTDARESSTQTVADTSDESSSEPITSTPTPEKPRPWETVENQKGVTRLRAREENAELREEAQEKAKDRSEYMEAHPEGTKWSEKSPDNPEENKEWYNINGQILSQEQLLTYQDDYNQLSGKKDLSESESARLQDIKSILDRAKQIDPYILDIGEQPELDTSFITDPAAQQEAQNNKNMFGLQKMRIKGEIWYALNDGTFVNEHDVKKLTPEQQAEVQSIDRDPKYADLAKKPVDYKEAVLKIGLTLADTFAQANLPKNVGKALGSFRVGLHAMLNGDMLGTAGAAVNASFNGLNILGDGVDSFKNQIKRRYGVTAADSIIEAGKTMRDRLITHETQRTRDAIGEALLAMSQAGGRAFGVRENLYQGGFQYDKQSLIDAGLSQEDVDLLDQALNRTYSEKIGGAQTPIFSSEDKRDINYMLLYGDYGYKPELMGELIAALNEQVDNPINSRGRKGSNPYYEALRDNQTYDFQSGLGVYAQIARPPLNDPVSQIESAQKYYEELIKASNKIGEELRSSERGYAYVYDEADKDHTTPLMGADGHPLTEEYSSMSSAERRILMAKKQVFDQALAAMDATTGNAFAQSRKYSAQLEMQEKARDKALKQARIDKYKSEPQDGAYQILAGKQDGTIAYEGLFESLQIPQDRFDKNGNSTFAKMDDLWRKIQATSEQAGDLLKSNQQYASLHNAWACMDAYRTYTTLATAVIQANPANAEALLEQLEEYLTEVCSENRWQGGDLVASNYTRMDMNKWLSDNLGIETEVLEDKSLNHLISGCGIEGEVEISSRGGPIFSDEVPMSKVNLLVDFDAVDRISGLAKRYIDLKSKVDAGVAMTPDEIKQYKRLGVFRAYQLRERTLAELRGLADAPDVKAVLKSVENQDAFRHEIMETLGKNPGWKWKDGEITEDWDIPTDKEATFEDLGYKHWDLNTQAGRIAALNWLKGLATREGVSISIDVNEIGKRRKKGLGEYMERPDKGKSTGSKGKFKISEYCDSDVGKQVQKRLESDNESVKNDAQKIKESLDKGEISLERVQYAVDNGQLKPISLDSDQSFSEIYVGLMGEIAALEKLGYISKTRDWTIKAKSMLAESLFEMPSEGKDYFEAVNERIQKICSDPSDKGKEYQDRILEKIEEIKCAASDAEKEGAPWSSDEILNEVFGECKDSLYNMMDKVFRQSIPHTKKNNTKAENKSLSEMLSTAHECLQDNDIKEYIQGKFSRYIAVDPATGLIHKDTKNKVRSNGDMVKSIRADIAEFKEKWDASSPDAEHEGEFIKKLTVLTDVIEITEKVFADSAKSGVHLPDDWALSVDGAPTKAMQFVSEVVALRETMGQSFGEYSSDLERDTFESQWHEIGAKYGIKFEKANAVDASNLNDWKNNMRANGGVIDKAPDTPDILEKHSEVAKDGVDKYIGAIIENAKHDIRWPADVFRRGADGGIGGEFVEGYDEGGVYSDYLKAMGISPFYIPNPEFPGEGISQQDSKDPDVYEKYRKDDELVKTTVKDWQSEVDSISNSAFNKLLYNLKLDIVVKNHSGKGELKPFRNNKKGDNRRVAFEAAWGANASDKDRAELKETVLDPEFIKNTDDLSALENCSLDSWRQIRSSALKVMGGDFSDEEKSQVIQALWDRTGLASRIFVKEGESYRPFKDGDKIPEVQAGYLDVSPSAVFRAIGEGARQQGKRYTNFIRQIQAKDPKSEGIFATDDSEKLESGAYEESINEEQSQAELDTLRFSGKNGELTKGDLDKLINNYKGKKDPSDVAQYIFGRKFSKGSVEEFEQKLGEYLGRLATNHDVLYDEFGYMFDDVLERHPGKNLTTLIHDPRRMLTAIATAYVEMAKKGRSAHQGPIYDARKVNFDKVNEIVTRLMDEYAPIEAFYTDSEVQGMYSDQVGDDVKLSTESPQDTDNGAEEESRKVELDRLRDATKNLSDPDLIKNLREKYRIKEFKSKADDESGLNAFLTIVNGSMNDLNTIFGEVSQLNEKDYTPQEKCEYIADMMWHAVHPGKKYTASALKAWRGKCIKAWDEWKDEHGKDNRQVYIETIHKKAKAGSKDPTTVDQHMRSNLLKLKIVNEDGGYGEKVQQMWAVGRLKAGEMGKRNPTFGVNADAKDAATLNAIIQAKTDWMTHSKRLFYGAATGHKIAERTDSRGKHYFVDSDLGDATLDENLIKKELESRHPGLYDTMCDILESSYKRSLSGVQRRIWNKFEKDYGSNSESNKDKSYFWIHKDQDKIYGDGGVLDALGFDKEDRLEMQATVEKKREPETTAGMKEKKERLALQDQYNFFNYYVGSPEYNEGGLANSKFGAIVQPSSTLYGLVIAAHREFSKNKDWGELLKKNQKKMKNLFEEYVDQVKANLTKPNSKQAKAIKAQMELDGNPLPPEYLDVAIRLQCWQRMNDLIESHNKANNTKYKMPSMEKVIPNMDKINGGELFKKIFEKKEEPVKEEPVKEEPVKENKVETPVVEEKQAKPEGNSEKKKLSIKEINALWAPLKDLKREQLDEADRENWDMINRLIKTAKHNKINPDALTALAEKYKDVKPVATEKKLTSAEKEVQEENARVAERAKKEEEEKKKELEEREKVLEGTGEDLFGERPGSIKEIQEKFFDNVLDENDAEAMAEAYGLDKGMLKKALRKFNNGDEEGARALIASAAADVGIFKSTAKVIRPKSSIQKSTAKVIRPKRK